MELVEYKHNQVFCDSSTVAKKFNIQHAKVVRTIETLADRLRVTNCHAKIEKFEKTYRNQTFTAYLMDREFFSMLCMRFNNDKALEWQIKFNNAFYEMEDRIIKSINNKSDTTFIEARQQTKLGRREETDVIKDFVDYATEQGSKNAKFYYKHITNSTYKALELMIHKKPALRDTLDIYQLSELLLAERVAKNSLKKYMDLGRGYKDIYKSVAEDLIVFGNSLKLN
jgi:Rha family phage regulatory protein